MKIRYKLYILTILSLFIFTNINSQVLETKSLPEERNYEIVIVKGISIPIFDGVPVDQLYLYAFHTNEGWKPIPFQIDEFDSTHIYHPDSIFNSYDELLFLAQDLGDKVTLGNWIENEDAKSDKRIEIEVVDGIDGNKKGWCYLYKSSTLTESDKSDIKYLTYDAINDSIIGRYYHAGYGNNWFPRNISITSEGQGNGKDFYDRTKFRIRAIPFPGIDLFLNENHLLISSIEYLIKGPIRIQRRDSLKFDIPNFDYSATFTRKFFPCFTNFHGNVELQAQWLFKVLRMSYDLNPDIAGAKFFSGDSNGVKNTNITVDGSSDKSSINLGLQKNSPNWTMVTGQFGTMLTINSVNFEKDTTYTEPYTQELYYWDDNTGAPLPIGMDTDTGDSVSYGDHGMIFKSDALVGVATYNSETYLLPANKTSDFAQKMFYNFNSPMFFRIRSQDFLTGVELAGDNHIPSEFRLRPNFPNPFNPTTNITFDLPKNDFVTLKIFDLQGRHIITLANNNKLNAGVHNYTWNGRDQNDNLVTSGIYLCTIKTGTFSATQKMAFVK